MGPVRLATLLGRWSPEAAWRHVAEGHLAGDERLLVALGRRAPEVARRWHSAAARIDVPALWERYDASGVGVAALGSRRRSRRRWPPTSSRRRCCSSPGDPDCIAGPRVAIVGTRRCTRYGRDVARELGRDLAAAGVSVVSGLALGIDGAAHAGALAAEAAPPIGVVGSGLDVVYPRRHARPVAARRASRACC